jgi:carboxypeptidase C (cathepsin A)
MRAISAMIAMMSIAAVFGARPKDEVLGLPECGNGLPSPWFSGYLTASPTKSLHYVFVTSLSDPDNDPVVVWFNGGPGCSSMLGFLQEHGPYSLADGTTNFTANPYSWNKEAHVIYIESPAGVGFSTCGNPAECKWNDFNTADDNL